jgi:S1-C subfamily serine protease
MNPDVFLEQKDVVPLMHALIKLLTELHTSDSRLALLNNAEINSALIGNLRLDSPPNILAQALVAAFKKHSMSSHQPDYHPMVKFLSYLVDLGLTESYGLSDEQRTLFSRLVEQGLENFKALKIRRSVGRIESPKGTGIGTGVLVGKNLLLTCDHVFSKTQTQQAWVRFGYTTGSYGLEDVFELDLKLVNYNSSLDYALVKIKGEPQQSIISPANILLNENEKIRLVHHPLGNPVVISSVGEIVQVGKDYIDHNVGADEGSSGAPIFNTHWDLVAIHRGHPGIGRSIQKGTLSGVPIRAFWDQIASYTIETETGVNS